MKLSSIIACFFVLAISLLTGCSTKSSLLETYPLHQEYTGSIDFRNKTVPLPEGSWRVIGTGIDGSFFNMVLLKNTDSKIMNDSIIVTVETGFTRRKNGYVKSKDFEKVGDYHYSEIINNEPGEAQDSYLVKHTRMTGNTKREHIQQAFKFFKENDYIVPTILIEGKHRFTGKHIKRKYLKFRYFKNPEAEGFAPPTNSVWATTDWHPLHINKDPEKAAYIEYFIELNKDLHKRLKTGFGE
jgi:glutaredoxin